ncbi:peptidase S10 [Methylobacterium sp. C25]|nr:peptidase S10 [Methylobacterium sp. C25]MCE4226067.1 peptidase S10 [Methylobacterium sp. C25]
MGCAFLAFAVAFTPLRSLAEAQNAPPGAARKAAERPAESRDGRKLPADSVTEHTLTLPGGRTIAFTATAGSLGLVDESGKLQSEIAFIAYVKKGSPEEIAARPVSFAINGGPGAASAYLNIGAIGPWRLPSDGASISPSQKIQLKPNAETWLDFTDLVFIDPVGTGYSRAADGDGKSYWNVESDSSVLASAIARYLRQNDRMSSPKFYVGESYGGFRGPLIASKLQEDVGVGLSGLVLLSPVLDFAWLQSARTTPWGFVTRLPSLAAAALERSGTRPTRSLMADAERYASGDYIADLLKGPSDAAAVGRLSQKVSALTGLDPETVRRQAGRPTSNSYQREIGRDQGRVSSAYDTSVTGWDPDPTAPTSHFEDPVLTALQAPLTSAMVDLYANTLNWRVTNMRYELLNGAVNRGWSWGSGRGAPEAMGALKGILSLDGSLRVLIAHGFTDLVTPYFASKILIDQMPSYGTGDRLKLAVYPGGHMFYSRADSRAAFHADAADLYARALKDRSDGTAATPGSRGERPQERPTP